MCGVPKSVDPPARWVLPERIVMTSEGSPGLMKTAGGQIA
jgi:hypothetical protein